MPALQGPRGAPDILPPRSDLFELVIRAAEDVFRRFGYKRIETPAFEQTELFERGLEATSDMVVKEMYRFDDRSGRSLTLRPEGTAPVMRAVLEHKLDKASNPVKLYYTAPMFRYERPQAGRYRAFTQVGVEAIGSELPEIDAEVILLGNQVFESVGLDVSLTLNSIGHPGCRSVYIPKLVEFLEAHREELCGDCQRKISTNPLRTFDCKVPNDREILKQAPLITDYLCGACADHFDAVKGLLGDLGISFDLDPRLVRGLDYYTRTTFTYTAKGLGAQDEAGGGGRYDGLAELLGGDRLPGIGFGLGVDRIMLALEAKPGHTVTSPLHAFIASVGEQARSRALLIGASLRRGGLTVDVDLSDKGLRSQFKTADRLAAIHVIVIGERELTTSRFTVRDMSSGAEIQVPEDQLLTYLKGQE